MKIGIVGGGVVGKATARAFVEHVDEVRVFDVMKERATHPLWDTLQTDLIFVCLPTPQKDGSLECDVSALHSFFNFKFGSANREHEVRQRNYVLRSTVPIGTTRTLAKEHMIPNLVHSPEFLTARTAIIDAHLPSRNIIGIPQTPPPNQVELYKALRLLYSRRYPGVPVRVMTSDESEAVKLYVNGFFAVKIAYFNEVRTLADKLGLNWDTVLEGVLSDGRIAHSHTKVPGPDGKRGFGGACLPKDLASLVFQLQTCGCWPCVTEGARKRNVDDREGQL